jgi:hypothetical protein
MRGGLPASEKRQGTKSRDTDRGYGDLIAASMLVLAAGRRANRS